MIKYLAISVILAFALNLSAQNPVGAWSDHLSWFSAKTVAISPSKIYASTGTGIIVYDKGYDQLGRLTRVQGLAETSISTIAWSSDQEALIIAYSSTNLDIVRTSSIYNIPDIMRKYIPGKKEIYRIIALGKYAYLATSFGIVVTDLTKNEIYDTWKPGNSSETAEVYDLAIMGNIIYAATNIGVFYADISVTGLSYFGNWSLMKSLPTPSGFYNAIIVSGNKIYVNSYNQAASGDSVYVINTSASLFSFEPGIYNTSFEKYQGGIIFNSKNKIRIYNENGAIQSSVGIYNPGKIAPDISHSMIEGNNIWIADNISGLVKGENFTIFRKLNIPGPYTNNVIYLTISQGKTFIAGGAVDNAWNNQWRPLQVFTSENNSWYTQWSESINDAMRVLPDPQNRNHYWVSSWGGGLVEYENDVQKNKYDYTNSPLQTIIPGQPYVRICGLAIDKSRNIWMTQSGVPGSVKVLKSDGSWITFPFTIQAPTIADILITRTGMKWILLPRGYGLFVLDDNDTPDYFQDDRTTQFLITDSDNKVISNVYSIAEDLDGNIWIGTDQGPAIYYDPDQIFEGNLKAFRAKVPRDDGTGLADYMLGTEIITSIAVDGANRKWVGTYSSGAYLLSEDGSEKLENYNESNSPILSNSIVSLDVDDSSGEVWIGTAKGVISVRGNATSGGEQFGDVYTFPNPVRENYLGNVTITGLMRNTEIRITDISGNLVYKTVSEGGQATWDLTTYNGERVSTGVYLVFCASEDGTSALVTKMLIIK
jgi:hypothetical protein